MIKVLSVEVNWELFVPLCQSREKSLNYFVCKMYTNGGASLGTMLMDWSRHFLKYEVIFSHILGLHYSGCILLSIWILQLHCWISCYASVSLFWTLTCQKLKGKKGHHEVSSLRLIGYHGACTYSTDTKCVFISIWTLPLILRLLNFSSFSLVIWEL